VRVDEIVEDVLDGRGRLAPEPRERARRIGAPGPRRHGGVVQHLTVHPRVDEHRCAGREEHVTQRDDRRMPHGRVERDRPPQRRRRGGRRR
jgi:hypothetical protein